MHELPQDITRRREEAAAAQAITLAEEKRRQTGVISVAMAAFDLAVSVEGAGRARALHDLKSAQIRIVKLMTGMQPTAERFWLSAFVNAVSVLAHPEVLPHDRKLAVDLGTLLVKQIRAARGL